MPASREFSEGAPPREFVAAIARAEVRRRKRLLTVSLSLLLVPVAAAAAFYAWGKEDAGSIAAGVRDVKRDLKSDLKSDLAPLQAALAPGVIEERAAKSVGEALPPAVKDVSTWFQSKESVTVRKLPDRVDAVEDAVKPVAKSLKKIDDVVATVATLKGLVGDSPVADLVRSEVGTSVQGVKRDVQALMTAKQSWVTRAEVPDLARTATQQVHDDLEKVSRALEMKKDGTSTLLESLRKRTKEPPTPPPTKDADGAAQRVLDDLASLQALVRTHGKAIEEIQERLKTPVNPAPAGGGRTSHAAGTIESVAADKSTCVIRLFDPGEAMPPDALLAVRRTSPKGTLVLVGYVRIVPPAILEYPKSPTKPVRRPTRTATGLGDTLHHLLGGDVVEIDLGG